MTENWNIVKSKRKKKAVNISNKLMSTSNSNKPDLKNLECHQIDGQSFTMDNDSRAISMKLMDVVVKLQETVFSSTVLEKITTKVGEGNKIFTLGVGRLSCSPASMLQLAFAISLHKALVRRAVDPLEDTTSQSHLIYDPIMSASEKLACEELGLMVCKDHNAMPIDANGLCLSPVILYPPDSCPSNGFASRIVYFMPHCPYQLYNEILWRHWGDGLERIVIIGNSFRSYLDRRLDSGDHAADCVRLLVAVGAMEEIPLWDDAFLDAECGRLRAARELNYLESAFNDLSLMWFPRQFLSLPQVQRTLSSSRPSSEAMAAAKAADAEMR